MVNKYSPIVDTEEQEGEGTLSLIKESAPVIRRSLKALVRRYGPSAVDWIAGHAKKGIETFTEGDGLYPAGKRVLGMGSRVAGRGRKTYKKKSKRISSKRRSSSKRRRSSQKKRSSSRKRRSSTKKRSSLKKVTISGGRVRF